MVDIYTMCHTVTSEQIDTVIKAYEDNKNDLENMWFSYENPDDSYWIDYCSDVTPNELFEQGYNNAIEFVCRVFGIELD